MAQATSNINLLFQQITREFVGDKLRLEDFEKLSTTRVSVDRGA